MAEVKEPDRIPTRMQLHLLVECKRLPEVVEEIAVATLSALGLDTEEEALRKKAAAAVEDVLRRYVAAFEWCGFTVFCQEAKGYDPWKLQEAEPVSWAGD